MIKKVKRWCKYWHFNVMGVLSDNEGHSNYLNIVSNLDGWHGTDSWKDNDRCLEDSWKIVLSNINKCTDDQIMKIERLCDSKKY